MYKIDFDIGNVLNTLNVLKVEKVKIDAMTDVEKSEYKFNEKKFNNLRMQQISRTYGELGPEMLRMLPLNSVKAIPIIYERLKKSHEKLIQEKDELKKKWHDECEKNFSKSLDHRSFHFKQYEKKNQQPKSYIAEIKAMSQKNLGNKNLYELKGGCKDCEFLCTYSQFEHIVVHSQQLL